MSSSPTVLVTGGMGCIGAWTLTHLLRRRLRVVNFDLSTDRHRLDYLLTSEEQGAISDITGDLTDLDGLYAAAESHAVTHIIHLAALQVPFCRANPALGAAVNVTGTVNVFEVARRLGIQHLAYASSIAVYGPASHYPDEPIGPDALPAPGTLYGVYKVANEGTAHIYWQDNGISSLALRPYTIYGVGRDQGLTSDPTQALLAAVAERPFAIQFGGRMQFQLASDVAQQFIDAALTPQPGAHVFNLGTPAASVAEFIAHVRSHIPSADLSHTPNTLPFPESFDDAPLKGHVDTVYATPLAEGIAQTLTHFDQLLTAGKVT